MGCHCLQYTVTPSIDPWHHMATQPYVHDILQPHALVLMQRLPEAILARVLQDCLRTVTTIPSPARSPDLSLIRHIWDNLVRRVGYFTSLNEREARLQQIWNEMSQDIIQNLYVRSYLIVHSR
ncbi:transposable element Tcb2 transposase [Trichonephila clavipes]|nr:transposable element Tcb2 transposase [Trichonephila clavipes]